VSALVLCAGAGAGDVGVVELGAVGCVWAAIGAIVCVWFSLCGTIECRKGIFEHPQRRLDKQQTH